MHHVIKHSNAIQSSTGTNESPEYLFVDPVKSSALEQEGSGNALSRTVGDRTGTSLFTAENSQKKSTNGDPSLVPTYANVLK